MIRLIPGKRDIFRKMIVELMCQRHWSQRLKMLRPHGKPNHGNFLGCPPCHKTVKWRCWVFFWISYILKIKPPHCSWGFQKHTTDPHYIGDPAVTSSNWPHLDLLQLDHPSTTILESPHPDRVRHLYTTTTSNSSESTTTLWPPKQVWHLQRRAFLRWE